MFEKWADKLRGKTQESEEEITFKSFETPDPEPAPEPAATSLDTVANADSGANIELKVTRPECFEDVSGIADYLIKGCTVVLNIEALERPVALRMLDFLNGVTYSTEGLIKKVAPNTYIITPHNVDVSDEDK